MTRYTAAIAVLIAGLTAGAGYHHFSSDLAAESYTQPPAVAIPPPSTGDTLKTTQIQGEDLGRLVGFEPTTSAATERRSATEL